MGDLLFSDLRAPSTADSVLMLEPDPLLGNVPWPAVETPSGPIGLHFNIEEAPTILERNRPFVGKPFRGDRSSWARQRSEENTSFFPRCCERLAP